MTTTAQSIIFEAQTQLSDLDGIRWAASELVIYLNDGQRESCVLRPDAFATTAALTLAAGVRQALPAACSKFFDMHRNTSVAAITKVDKKLLEVSDPTWYSRAGSATIQHFCFDPREPLAFDVYPPATTAASVDLIYAATPAEVAAPTAPGLAYTTVTGNINCPDAFKNALISFVLFRAFAKDAEAGGNAALSAAHYQLFTSGLGVDAATKQAVAPS